MTTGYITSESLRYAADYIDIQLRGIPYAFIGGIACSILGSTRATHDFDIVVMDGSKDNALKQLAQNTKAFGTDGRGTWETIFDGKHHNVDIIEPHQIAYSC